MNGVEAFAEIRRLRPGARIIMMTGYRIEQLLAEAVDNGAVSVLCKPFTVAQTLAALEKARPAGIVLIADDDREFVSRLAPVLEEHGYRVLTARTGREALEKASAEPLDILILDLQRPILQGLEAYQALKRSGRVLPTIIVAGYDKEKFLAVDALRSLSVTGCLFKPFRPEALLKGLRTLSP